MEMLRNLLHQVFAKVAADNVSTHRKRQSGLLMPPFAEIEHFVQPHLLVEKLPFMDQQSGVNTSFKYGVDDLVELDDLVLEIAVIYPKCKKRAGEFAGNGDLHLADLFSL